MVCVNKYLSIVKKYKRRNGNQYLITLKQDNPFIEDEDVYIISKTEYDKQEMDNISHENIIKDLKSDNQKYLSELLELRKSEIKFHELQDRHDKLSMEYKEKTENLQDRHDKLTYQIMALQNLNKNYLVAITKLENLSFMNRLRNRIPENIKALTTGDKK